MSHLDCAIEPVTWCCVSCCVAIVEVVKKDTCFQHSKDSYSLLPGALYSCNMIILRKGIMFRNMEWTSSVGTVKGSPSYLAGRGTLTMSSCTDCDWPLVLSYGNWPQTTAISTGVPSG